MERPTLNGPLTWSLLSIGIVVLAAALTLPPLLRAAFGPGADVNQIETKIAQLQTDHTESNDVYMKRFEGRSIFFKPPPIRRSRPAPPPTIQTPVDEEPKSTPPPPPPRRYGGPKVTGCIGNTVFFEKGVKIAVGEERDGVEILSVAEMPYQVKVRWRGGEHDVVFQEKIAASLFKKPERSGLFMPEKDGDDRDRLAASNRETSDTKTPTEQDERVAAGIGTGPDTKTDADEEKAAPSPADPRRGRAIAHPAGGTRRNTERQADPEKAAGSPD